MVKITSSIWWGDDPRDVQIAAEFYAKHPLRVIEKLMNDPLAGDLTTFVVYLLHS